MLSFSKLLTLRHLDSHALLYLLVIVFIIYGDWRNETVYDFILLLSALCFHILDSHLMSSSLFLVFVLFWYSGPSRFDWDRDANAWIYRRTEANLHKLLEEELENLCGEPIQLS